MPPAWSIAANWVKERGHDHALKLEVLTCQRGRADRASNGAN